MATPRYKICLSVLKNIPQVNAVNKNITVRREIYFSKQSCTVLLIVYTVNPNEIPNLFTIKHFLLQKVLR